MDKKVLENVKFRVSAPVIMLVVALVIAGIVSFWSYGLLQKKTVVDATPTDTQQVAVAAYDLKWGTVITSEVVKTQPYLKGSLPTGYIADPTAAVGRVVMYPIQVNEPLTESRLAPASVKQGGVAAVVSPKKRAMAVKVDKVVGVSGFIHPGHRVDVLVTLSKVEKLQQPITKIVLENIPVLAVGAEVEQTGQKEKPAQVDVITLEVTPEEGEKLALAATEGKLQMALRNSTDTENVATRGATVPTLLGSYAGGAAPKQVSARKSGPAPQAASARPSVTIIQLVKGNQVEQLTFGRGE